MENIFKSLIEVLKADARFFSEDGVLLRNRVAAAANANDEALLKLLIADRALRQQFFTEFDGMVVFNQRKFGYVVNNRQFLPDSYTRFKNKIGLADSRGNLLVTKNDVELVFPYKDCILEGGQTKDDQKREEVFYNETLAPEEVDRLLYPKVLVGAKRYTSDGAVTATQMRETDNLIIKGNNLLALSSLLKRFEGQIKCIYIDPPYNTGKKNSFGYNDCFNHSSWLTFMKNRLELARKLLSPDGILLVQVDDKEQAYLKVLCDEIFGMAQFETSFFVQVRFTDKTLAEDSALHKVIETVHVYSKKHENFLINKIKQEYSIDKFCWRITECGEEQLIEVGGKKVGILKDGSYKIEQVSPDFDNLKETWATGSLIRQGGTAAEFLSKYLIDRKKEDGLKVLYKVYNMGEDGLGFRYILGPQKSTAFRGKFYSGIPTSIKENVKNGTHNKEMPVPNFIYNYLSFEGEFGNCRKEGDVDISGGKKPEQLIRFFLDYFCDKNSIVLDFFLGSGTTVAVAHKMGIKYIGVEQLDYGVNDSIVRLNNVIKGDKTGISSDIDWQGGGSFVYCELAKCNQGFVDAIEAANSDEDLLKLFATILKTEFISCKVNPNEIAANAGGFAELSTDDKKKFLMLLLDKNMLYVNLCDMNDEDYEISENDRAFTKSFYGEK